MPRLENKEDGVKEKLVEGLDCLPESKVTGPAPFFLTRGSLQPPLLTTVYPRPFILHIAEPSFPRSSLSSLAIWIPHELSLDHAPAFHST